jgi:polyhydroxybutyrate depolymerase
MPRVAFSVSLLSLGAAVDFTRVTVDHRDVDVWVPECAQPSAPIILSLHAWATNRGVMEGVDRLPDYAGSECAIIVYPQGKSRGESFGVMGFSWNAGGCCPNANTDHIDDVGFLDHVITAVAEKFNGNEQLVGVVGVSNGGMMANRLACTNERVKVLVSMSGPLINGTDAEKTESFQCRRSVPMLHMHGDADIVIPYDGCSQSSSRTCKSLAMMPGFPPLPWPSVPAYIADWRVRNGIPTDSEGTTTFTNASTSCTSWGSSANNVTLCTLGGEGHAWPNACAVPNLLPGMHCTHDIDGSHHTMEFFRQHFSQTTYVV